MSGFLSLSGIWLFSFILQFIFLRLNQNLALGLILGDAFTGTVCFIILASGFPSAAKYLEFRPGRVTSFILTHISGALIIALIWGILFFLSNKELYRLWGEDLEFYPFLIERLPIGLLLYFLTQSVIYLIRSFEEVSEEKLRREELRKVAVENELKSLKYQLNPHFLFNSLNSISSLALTQPAAAREMTVKLSDYLRLTLSEEIKKFIPLKEELENTRLYVSIEKIRFEERIHIAEEIEEDVLNQLVPSMILQPIIENAVKYGVQNSPDVTTITLRIRQKEDGIRIDLSNNNASAGKGGSTGVGLNNLSRRLELIYKEKNLVETSLADEIFTVKIRLPKI